MTETVANDSSAVIEAAEPRVESYSITMAPVGIIEPDEVPKSVFIVPVHHVDMAIVPGHGDALNVMYSPSDFEDNYNRLLERLSGVSVG